MNENDPRTGYPESDTVEIATGDGNTPQTALEIPDDALFVPTQVKISYDNTGTADATVSLYDEADGTAAADASDRRDRYRTVAPGEVRSVDSLDMRDFEEGVLVAADGNQDASVDVTVYGRVLTGLADVYGAGSV